ncbi:hypothetical protein GW819_01045 [Candidatus Gracilibacteria bacterium]|nr:hypothetical protein [bacterium]NDK19407.1 hypothetical protein [Candidatus Gracilibacteria bacterium]OIO77371.1 MAG: hypothetical protein AUJ87_01470 [Candidatus Gracilibacteria bacterium CG1_02_38_174]PIQ12082.1 MAG: hypothetical protein COW68_01070 [Candidatus Gracilibacteria bacterium CG18_big_fil_WC_8_21_14_2_50_38_16]PIQ42265.1 MAG: hypothetical protein COW06_00305 [Candidatus Gracilibacteria bacterium CG12_big_fil_rev_8_21_14_0_65_38_15]PIZ01374.1 MAG: hypothetical protein COY60_0400
MNNDQLRATFPGPFLTSEEMEVLMRQPLRSVDDIHEETSKIAMEIANGRYNPFTEEERKN